MLTSVVFEISGGSVYPPVKAVNLPCWHTAILRLNSIGVSSTIWMLSISVLRSIVQISNRAWPCGLLYAQNTPDRNGKSSLRPRRRPIFLWGSAGISCWDRLRRVSAGWTAWSSVGAGWAAGSYTPLSAQAWFSLQSDVMQVVAIK